jgi:threonine 3-dehydrogenase
VRAVVKSGPTRGATVHTDFPEPGVGSQDVLVQVVAASVCGTDREMVEWTPAAAAFGLRTPVVMGHECAGTVVAVGEHVRGVRVGDRVALESHVPCGGCYPCRTGDAHNCADMRILGMHVGGAFAELVAVPEAICFPLPEALSFEVGALLEPAGVAWHAVQRSERGVAGGLVLVSGCGPVGLVIIQLSSLLGASRVVAVEPNPYRRALAEGLGATAVAPSDDVVGLCRELAGRRGGMDVAFEASAAPSALPVLLDAVRREATVVTVGHPGRPIEIDIASHINKKGITLRGVFGRRLWDTWEQTSLLVASNRLDLEPLITHRLPVEALEEAVDLLDGEACKVLLKPELRAA